MSHTQKTPSRLFFASCLSREGSPSHPPPPAILGYLHEERETLMQAWGKNAARQSVEWILVCN
jgi:hypothetical protein